MLRTEAELKLLLASLLFLASCDLPAKVLRAALAAFAAARAAAAFVTATAAAAAEAATAALEEASAGA